MPESLSTELAPKLAVELGLKLDEYEKIVVILGRVPSVTELYMYSLMWSEHCSYKHSRKALRMFPTEGPHVLQGPGENAGVIDVGDGWAVAFKMESHNHPCAIEPYQGAATGVGGIIRDIFTMGARPIASLELAALRHARQAAPALPVRGLGRRHRRLRQLPRRPHRGRRGRTSRKRYDGNRLVNAMSHRRHARRRDHPRHAPPAPATSCCSSARRPAETASAARPCSPARSSTSAPRTSARPSRWATRSRRSCSSRRASSCSATSCSSASGTAAPPASPARSARWPTAGDVGRRHRRRQDARSARPR